jgi:hypothetical protein
MGLGRTVQDRVTTHSEMTRFLSVVLSLLAITAIGATYFVRILTARQVHAVYTKTVELPSRCSIEALRKAFGPESSASRMESVSSGTDVHKWQTVAYSLKAYISRTKASAGLCGLFTIESPDGAQVKRQFWTEEPVMPDQRIFTAAAP